MKNILGVLGFVSLGLLAACASQPKPQVVATPAEAPVAPTVAVAPVVPAVHANSSFVVSGTNWSFTMPNDNWVKTDPVGKDYVLAYLRDREDKKSVMFVSGPFTGPIETFPMAYLAGIEEHGGKIISTKEVLVNGNTYFYIAATSADISAHVDIFTWLVVKNAVGYGFICGGHQADDLQSTCDNIVSTLQLK
jgi:hypothetical protein